MGRGYFNKGNLKQTNSLPAMEVKLFGRWEETTRVIQTMGPAAKEAGIRTQLKLGKEICKRVKAHLRNQDLRWRPLSPSYAERKSAAGLNPQILMAYGVYYNSISVWQVGTQHMVMIGVKRGIYTFRLNGKKSKIEVSKIAAIHEFSNGVKVPRRPLWNPTIREMGGVKGIKEMYITSFISHLRVRGIPIKRIRGLF